jgi:hypothetical protein
LQEFFSECIVGCGLWPLRSPDLTPPDLFLWGFLKERISLDNPRSLEELKNSIEQTVANSDSETLWKITENTKEGGCSSLRRWWTFSASTVKLFHQFFLKKKTPSTTCFSYYIDVIKAYKYCCN